MHVEADSGLTTLTTLADAIKAKHQECLDASSLADTLWLERSALLRQAKALVPHGQWIPWVEEHCGFGRSQASRYLRISNGAHREHHLKDNREQMSKHRAKTSSASYENTRDDPEDAEWCRAKEQEEPDTADDVKSAGDEALAEEIIEAGYRALAKRCHPDVGGTHLQMVQLTSVKQRILTLINGGF